MNVIYPAAGEDFAGSVENHRGRENGVIVYPVYSRRSGGLSLGINLFPERKICSFDCPYCEVFPFTGGTAFSAAEMERELRLAVKEAAERTLPVKDFCFSGNGEPTMAAGFPGALEAAVRLRGELAPGAELVLITNGTGLLEPSMFSLLREAASGTAALRIWLKLDAGTAGWYEKINKSDIPFAILIEKIKEFVSLAPVTVQTMMCAVDGDAPPPAEETAWQQLALELAALAQTGSNIRAFHIYGKARPAPEDPKTEALPESYLQRRADSLRRALPYPVAVDVFP